MKKKLISILTISMLFIMIFSMNALASSGSGQVTVNAGGAFKIGVKGVSRTGASQKVNVKANSVYPIGDYEEDNYKKCKTKIYKNNHSNAAISDAVTLTEGDSYTGVTIKEDYKFEDPVDIGFAGNDPSKGAVIDFSYQGN